MAERVDTFIFFAPDHSRIKLLVACYLVQRLRQPPIFTSAWRQLLATTPMAEEFQRAIFAKHIRLCEN